MTKYQGMVGTEVVELTDWMLDGRAVRVPHDAMLQERRSPDAPTGSAGAYFWGGTYTYDRVFDIPESWAGKQVTLEFEGVMGHTTVLVDGHAYAVHDYGYTGFTVDITSAVTPGKPVVIAVIANNEQQPNSRWYAGSGIYRPVRVVAQSENHIVRNGITVTTQSIDPTYVRITTQIAGVGEAYVRIERNGVAIAGHSGSDVVLGIADARLWSADEPNLYTCRVELRDSRGSTIDVCSVPFGIRTLSWDSRGFLVNGVPVKLQGGCVHHDNGILGAADLPAASRRKVAMLKEWGFNAIRSAHNPLSQSMLDACDELGMYVMDEYADMWYQRKNPYDYANDFTRNYLADLTDMVQKDRNHPSVVMYSIGNENVEPYEAQGVDTAHRLAQVVHELDDTRPVTAGVNPTILFAASLGIDSFNADGSSDAEEQSTNTSLAYNTYVAKMGDVMEFMAGSLPVGHAVAPYLDELDIAGYNYATRRYRPDLRRRPNRLVFGSETMPYDIARNWRMVERDSRIIGDFMWTAWDYLGECSLAAWSDDPTPVSKPYPWLCADTGALDLIGDPNGEAALAKVVWDNPQNPLLFVRPADLPNPYTAPWRGTNSIPCWSWRGSEGNLTTVEVYTQAPIAKLFLNGHHVGTRRTNNCHANFRVRYESGELLAVACTSDGLELGRTMLRSTDGPLRLRLLVERKDEDIAFVRVDVVDAKGTVEGGRSDDVRVWVDGGRLLAFGSSAQKSARSYLSGTFPLRYGRGLAVVRVRDEHAVVHAAAGTLPMVSIRL